MPLTGDEIRRRLAEFAARWGGYAGSERGEAQDQFRYTPTSAFETFPWPSPTDAVHTEIGQLSARLIERRQAICLERQIGLTRLYNEVEEGAYSDVADLHLSLDRAVAAAYGWPASAAADPTESNRLLLELNRQIAAGEIEYDPF